MHIVIDQNGNPWGPFEMPEQAWHWAEKKWPGDGPLDEAGGWDVVALRSPDES